MHIINPCKRKPLPPARRLVKLAKQKPADTPQPQVVSPEVSIRRLLRMDKFVLHNDDSLAILKSLAPQSIKAFITDPPYCSGAHESAKRAKRNNITPESVKERPMIESDAMGTLGYEWVTRNWLLSARRATVPGGHLVVFTDWRMLPQTAMLIESAGWRWNNVIVWDKGYPGLGAGFRAQHEMIILASNGAPEWSSYDYGNVIQTMRLTQTEHPHQKPLDLLMPLIITCTNEGEKVLDPFMGSGTTGVACMQLNRYFIGIEIDPSYYKIAKSNIEIQAAQGNLFVEKPPNTALHTDGGTDPVQKALFTPEVESDKPAGSQPPPVS